MAKLWIFSFCADEYLRKTLYELGATAQWAVHLPDMLKYRSFSVSKLYYLFIWTNIQNKKNKVSRTVKNSKIQTMDQNEYYSKNQL